MRDYGQSAKYVHDVKGWNSRLDSIQAAILSVKLRRLDEANRCRGQHADTYRRRLQGVGDLRMQSTNPNGDHVFHLFLLESAQRNELRAHLEADGIETGIHYPTPIHLQPAFAELALPEGSFPHSGELAGFTLSLPMFPSLTDAQIDRVVGSIKSFFDCRQTTGACTVDAQPRQD